MNLKEQNMWNTRMLCPKCQGQWTHLIGVKAYFRAEDASNGFTAEISHDGVAASSNAGMEGCPSLRRDGVTLTFECESCQDPELLHVVQHKGETFFFWENGYPEVPFNDGTVC